MAHRTNDTSRRGYCHVGKWGSRRSNVLPKLRPDELSFQSRLRRAAIGSSGLRIAYRRPTMPAPKQLLQYGERWKPHRTVAVWYLRRVADR